MDKFDGFKHNAVMLSLPDQLKQHIATILKDSLKYSPSEKAFVVYDEQTQLSRWMTDAYRSALPDASFVNFDEKGADGFFAGLETLVAGDLVILVQSTNFRLNDFRIRIELFKRGLKTIEHLHLARQSEDQWQTFVDAFAYDSEYYHQYGLGIKNKLAACDTLRVQCEGTELIIKGGFEEAKLNIGDYTGMENVGGTFPIGEVFTEAKTLENNNGELMIFGFANDDHYMQIHQPFKAMVKNGVLELAEGAPQELVNILNEVRLQEPTIIREVGFGLNRAMGKNRIVNDVTTFERQYGLHLSIGLKHSVYKKPGIAPKHTRYHIDVFVDVKRILLDDEVLFENGAYRI